MAAARAAKKRSRRAAPAASGARARVIVSADERCRLIDDCAFFQAGQFREVRPGAYRKSDVAAVAAEIDAAIGSRVKAGRSR